MEDTNCQWVYLLEVPAVLALYDKDLGPNLKFRDSRTCHAARDGPLSNNLKFAIVNDACL